MNKMIGPMGEAGHGAPLLAPCGFRAATFGDLNPIVDIENSSFPAPWPRLVFIGEICGRNWSRVTVAEVEGCVVGYMIYWTVITEVHLLNLAVAPAWRQKGVGRSLMDHLIEESGRENIKEILLEVRVSNQTARRMYEHFHFKEVAVQPGYYSDNGEDALVMSLLLR
jgi:ribosomal-protein-alanine N-acetyltransferase